MATERGGSRFLKVGSWCNTVELSVPKARDYSRGSPKIESGRRVNKGSQNYEKIKPFVEILLNVSWSAKFGSSEKATIGIPISRHGHSSFQSIDTKGGR